MMYGGGNSGGTFFSSPLKLVVLVQGEVVDSLGVVNGEQSASRNSCKT